MNHFNLLIEDYSRSNTPWTPKTLYSGLWFDITYQPEIIHKDNTLTPEHVRIACTPFPFLFIKIVDLKKLRNAIMVLDMEVPRDVKEFPSEEMKKRMLLPK